MNNAFTHLLSEREKLNLDRVYVICSKGITNHALDYILNVLRDCKCNEHLIEFMDAEAITDKIIETI